MANAKGHPRQCTGHHSSDGCDSTGRKHWKKGERCESFAIRGGSVCRTHGGAAPAAKKAARLRLAALVDPAIDYIHSVLKPGKGHKKAVPPNVRLAAAKDALDRNGFKAKDELVLTQEFDPTQFAHMSDEDVETLLKLARKASTLRDVHDKSV